MNLELENINVNNLFHVLFLLLNIIILCYYTRVTNEFINYN
jgi:hypothetical protein